MNQRWFCALAAAGMAALPVAAWAQASGPRSSPGLQQPHLRDDEQIMPSQIVQPPPPPTKPKGQAGGAETGAGGTAGAGG
jgi:hypothetical protein